MENYAIDLNEKFKKYFLNNDVENVRVLLEEGFEPTIKDIRIGSKSNNDEMRMLISKYNENNLINSELLYKLIYNKDIEQLNFYLSNGMKLYMNNIDEMLNSNGDVVEIICKYINYDRIYYDNKFRNYFLRNISKLLVIFTRFHIDKYHEEYDVYYEEKISNYKNILNIIDILFKYFLKNNVLDIIIPTYSYYDEEDEGYIEDVHENDLPINHRYKLVDEHCLVKYLRRLLTNYNRPNESITQEVQNIKNNMKEILYSIIFRSCSSIEIGKLKHTLERLFINEINNISIDSITSTEEICNLLSNDNDKGINIHHYKFLDEYIKPAIQTRHEDEDEVKDEIIVQHPNNPESIFDTLKMFYEVDMDNFLVHNGSLSLDSYNKRRLSLDYYDSSILLLNYNKDVDIKTLEELRKYLSDLYEDIKTNHNITIIKDFDKEFNLLSTIIDNINDYILNKLSDAKLLNDKLNILYEFYLNLRLFLNNLILIICFYINNEHNLCIKPKINVKEEDIYRYFMNGYNIGNLSK